MLWVILGYLKYMAMSFEIVNIFQNIYVFLVQFSCVPYARGHSCKGFNVRGDSSMQALH